MRNTAIIMLFAAFLFIAAGCFKDEKRPPEPPAPSKTPEIQYYVNETVGYKVPVSRTWKIEPALGIDLNMISKDGTFTPEPSINVITVKQKEYDVWDKKVQETMKREISSNLVPAAEENLTIKGRHAYKLVYGLENDSLSKMISQTNLFVNGYLMVITCSAREAEFARFDNIFTELINGFEFMPAKEPGDASGNADKDAPAGNGK